MPLLSVVPVATVAFLLVRDDSDAYSPQIEPGEFTTDVDNPYLPLTVGTRWVYEATDDEGATERIVVEVTNRTKRVMGVDCLVVRDTVTVDGEVFEDTFDWFAQDADGNVWYFGEETREFEDGEVSSAGSWEAGMDGAQPGIVMKARPRVGDDYRQEFYEGEAEDRAKVLALDEQVSVPFGSFDGVLKTEDVNPLEPGVVEQKFYARGVGLVQEEEVRGGSGRTELIEMSKTDQEETT